MAAEEHAAQGITAGEYIGHHLTHFQTQKQAGVIDFSVFNLDSIFWSVLLGVIGMFVMWRVARTVTSGVPGRMQAAVEILLEMVDSQAKGIIHNAESRKFVGPLALTVFVLPASARALGDDQFGALAARVDDGNSLVVSELWVFGDGKES
jgi:F-type H+-transporting ATPase subunit a